MAFIPSRRQHARFACSLPLKVVGAGSRNPIEGTMLNVGVGGAFLALKGGPHSGSFTLRVTCGEETVSLDARVVRNGGSDPNDRQAGRYGVEFRDDPETKGRVRLLVDRVRSRLPFRNP